MVAIGPGEVQGTVRLKDHFQKLAARGGQLKEIDKYTTTMGVVDLIVNKSYTKGGLSVVESSSSSSSSTSKSSV